MTKRILVVDDEPFVLKILTKRLVANGYLVLSASNGAEVITKLPTFRPDAILLDVMLPGMDGVQIAEQLGRSPARPPRPSSS